MQELLAGPDREVETTTSPEEALTRCRVTPFDLVITDLQLGGRLDGIDVLRGVHQASPATPVIIVTGRGKNAIEDHFDAVLDNRLVHERQHFLRLGFRGREKPGAEAGGGKDDFPDG